MKQLGNFHLDNFRSALPWGRFRFTNSFLHKNIPKTQKDTDDLTVFLRFWDLCLKKLSVNKLNMLVLVKPTTSQAVLGALTNKFSALNANR